ncbi:MAG: hypothetical protein WAM71_20875 [Candidatus Korobacteraceae bacterium]
MNVYFTVDTESSMGGAWEFPERLPVPADRHVFCRTHGAEYGIPLITKILSEYGMRATHFVEALAALCLGAGDTLSIVDYLLSHGQDVQLHLHPVYWFYAKTTAAMRGPAPCDMIGQLSPEVQSEMLGTAVDLFQKYAGFRPIAFRAGNWAGSRSLMRTLSDMDIKIDSSFNPACHPEVSFPDLALKVNQIQQVNGILEIPITVARSRLPEGYHGFKLADCTSLSFAELRKMLNDAAAAGQQHFVMVFHSFSAVKARDIAYRQIRPNRIVIRRLQRTIRYLAENTDRFRVRTFKEIAAEKTLKPHELSVAAMPELPLVRGGVRKFIQAVNNFYWV